jgi:PAS domain S-box-containing protein
MLLDQHGYLDCNSAAVRMFGMRDKAEFCATHPGELSPPQQPCGSDSRALANERIATALHEGALSFEWVHKRAGNGDVFAAEVLLSALQLDGRPALQATVRDVTDRQRAEEALREARDSLARRVEERTAELRRANEALKAEIGHRKQVEEECRVKAAALDAAANAIVITNRDGTIQWVNPAWTSLTGYRAEEAIGKTPRILKSDAQNCDYYAHLWQVILSGNVWRGELVNRRKDDSLYTEEETITPVLGAGGAITHFIAIKQDVTARRSAEAALRESEDRYRDLVEHSEDLICTHTLDGRLLSVNPRAARLLGYTQHELLQMQFRDLLVPEVSHLFDAYLTEIRERGVARGTMQLQSRAGDTLLWEYHNTLRTEGVAQPLIRGMARDITEQKRSEQERKKLQAQLAQAQKMDSVGRLAGGVAHDFNNMLTVILGHTELALELTPETHALRADLHQIRHAAIRSADLTQQLLAFSRRQTVAPKVLDLNDAVAGVLKMLRRLIGEDIHLVWRPGADVWAVKIDPAQVHQLLTNLAVNARDAIGGVGTITMETSNVTLDAAFCATHIGASAGRHVMLTVSDDGCGMGQEVLDHLFEPFFTTKGVGQGTGLGLATVYGIVTQNRGHIHVYSEPGAGSTFSVYLPQFAGDTESLAQHVAAPPRARGETLLMVEDDAAILQLGKTMLASLGYTVLTAGTPGEALRLAEDATTKIDLLITDVVMPEMNGREMSERLMARRPGLKRVFMSGYTAEAIAHRGVLHEGVQFIQKPFSRLDLALKIRETLDA